MRRVYHEFTTIPSPPTDEEWQKLNEKYADILQETAPIFVSYPNRVKNRSGYVYEYQFRKLIAVQFDTLVDLFGIDTAIELVVKHGGTYMKIPTIKQVYERFRYACLRQEAILLLKEGYGWWKTCAELEKRYYVNEYKNLRLKRLVMQMLRGEWETKEDELEAKIAQFRDERLLYLIKTYRDKLLAADLI